MSLSKVIISTGCTSGLGHATLSLLLKQSPAPPSEPLILIVGSRSIPPLHPLPHSKNHSIHYIKLDLTDLQSVHDFAHEAKLLVPEGVGGSGIDVVFLNAGVWKQDEVEVEGTGWGEEAIVNHFSQHYLLQVLSPLLTLPRPTLPRTRIVMTTSSLQNSVRSLDSPTLADILNPLSSLSPRPTPKERYSASKFVQMTAASGWSKMLEGMVDVVAVSPGFIPTTGLNRESSVWGRFFLKWILYWAPFCSSVEQGSSCPSSVFITSPPIAFHPLPAKTHVVSLSTGAKGLLHAFTVPIPLREDVPSQPSTLPTITYLNNTGSPLAPSPLIAIGGKELVKEWSPSREEIEKWID
ncbi:hypothetical protein P7C70_g932, partial [Phenoliferia sp. Uapishka_3]